MAASDVGADSVFLNGRVYAVDGSFSQVSALAVKRGRLVGLGTDEEVLGLAGPLTEKVDLEGAVVLPGIVESHLHLFLFGESLGLVQAHWRPKEEILAAVAAAVADARCDGGWILGRGWNQEVWSPPLFPTRHELDLLAPDLPVYLERTCCHAAWVNGKALELAGIDASTADPEGGEIRRDEKGEPTGLLVDTAMRLVTKCIPPRTREGCRKVLLTAQKELFAQGITSACDMGTTPELFVLLEELYARGEMSLRVHGYGSSGVDGGVSLDAYASFLERGPRADLCDGRLHLTGLKLFSDGSLGARSAWMEGDYADRPGHRGNPREGGETLYAVMAAGVRRGFQIATHAIGDAANALVLDLYERLQRELPQARALRLRVEHAQHLRPCDFKRFADLALVASVQPTHATSDWAMAVERLGEERTERAYAWRDLLDRGVALAAGSDAPVESPNPFEGIFAAVTRRDRQGRPEGGWHPRQAMTRVEALRAFTVGGAWAVGAEKDKGSLEAGRRADFIAVDRDILTCPEEEIGGTKVLRTVVGGETVFLL